MRIIALLSLLIASPLMGMFYGTPIRKFFYGNGKTGLQPFLPPYAQHQKKRPLRNEINAIKNNAQQAKIDAIKWQAKENSKKQKK